MVREVAEQSMQTEPYVGPLATHLVLVVPRLGNIPFPSVTLGVRLDLAAQVGSVDALDLFDAVHRRQGRLEQDRRHSGMW